MIKCILVDFDNTLTTKDTTKFLIVSLILKKPFRIWAVFIGYLLIKLSFDEPKVQKWKNWIIINLIRGLNDDELSRSLNYFNEKVSKVLNKDILSYFRSQRDEGYHTLLVSASPEFAIRSIPELADFEILGSIFSKSRIKSCCFGQDKVDRIIQWQKANLQEIRIVQAWSDSLSDLPMMNLAEKKIWVCSLKKQSMIKEKFPNAFFWNHIKAHFS